MVTRATTSVHRVEVEFWAGAETLAGTLALPGQAGGLVLFVRDPGGRRDLAAEETVVRDLHSWGIGTLQFDLTIPAEGEDGPLPWDLGPLVSRLIDAIYWARYAEVTRDLPIGLFGTGVGAAVAFLAAVRRSRMVGALASIDGRPDLAGADLTEVDTPSLLVVHEANRDGISFNEDARELIRGRVRLEVIPKPSEAFPEERLFEEVSQMVCRWFEQVLIEKAGTRDLFRENPPTPWLQ